VSGVIFLAYKYADDPARALVVNAELSGDNCNRGSLLGCLVGMGSSGLSFVPRKLEAELHQAETIHSEIKKFTNFCVSLDQMNEAPAPLRLAEFLEHAEDVKIRELAAPPRCTSG